jgi:hypothetical protein
MESPTVLEQKGISEAVIDKEGARATAGSEQSGDDIDQQQQQQQFMRDWLSGTTGECHNHRRPYQTQVSGGELAGA